MWLLFSLRNLLMSWKFSGARYSCCKEITNLFWKLVLVKFVILKKKCFSRKWKFSSDIISQNFSILIVKPYRLCLTNNVKDFITAFLQKCTVLLGWFGFILILTKNASWIFLCASTFQQAFDTRLASKRHSFVFLSWKGEGSAVTLSSLFFVY